MYVDSMRRVAYFLLRYMPAESIARLVFDITLPTEEQAAFAARCTATHRPDPVGHNWQRFPARGFKGVAASNLQDLQLTDPPTDEFPLSPVFTHRYKKDPLEHWDTPTRSR